ncbi:MAG: hypothetical protein ACOX81_02370 [Candidatus Heteroscillospira sp.]|jgi:hypothetical protein
MELRLVNGDYAKTRFHDLESVSGAEETAQRIMMKLSARRGGFALLPEYGSRLYALNRVRPGQRESCARQYVAEALAGEDAVLESLALRESGSRLILELSLRCGGDSIDVTTEI